MKILVISSFIALCYFPATLVQASDRPAHFSGKAVSDVQQASKVFLEKNTELANLLAGELNPTSVTAIHQLTYTLENALALIPNTNDQIKAALEEVHLGSEYMDYERVKRNGATYLQLAKSLTE
ncbi:DUF6746 family protein [Alishewanella sp. SMS8]|uniref:DUF6746 family protein n=1 Tax=Alishewanella sp. SMS8 TaxID=2994676 RepID=UPI002741DA37|nr:DUF6746 family protein [Alishewanella sp. SMS8]MDP5187519.1 hypothetical protein [Alishewanella sp.]MDP5460826.1 hypothetical protein [Alishewanella sp. SMS8]